MVPEYKRTLTNFEQSRLFHTRFGFYRYLKNQIPEVTRFIYYLETRVFEVWVSKKIITEDDIRKCRDEYYATL